MTNIRLEHLALSEEHAKKQLLHERNLPLNLANLDCDAFDATYLEHLGKNGDGVDIFKFYPSIHDKPDSDNDRWTYEEIVEFYGKSFKIVIEETETGWKPLRFILISSYL